MSKVSKTLETIQARQVAAARKQAEALFASCHELPAVASGRIFNDNAAELATQARVALHIYGLNELLNTVLGDRLATVTKRETHPVTSVYTHKPPSPDLYSHVKRRSYRKRKFEEHPALAKWR